MERLTKVGKSCCGRGLSEKDVIMQLLNFKKLRGTLKSIATGCKVHSPHNMNVSVGIGTSK